MALRYISWLIIVLVGTAVFIDLPGSLPRVMGYQFSRPAIDFNLFGIKFYRDLEIKEGLDLAGGTHLVLQADMERIQPLDRDAALASLKGIIERRVDLFGVSEPVVQTAKEGGHFRVLVELAGIKDVNQAVELVGKTADLSFREMPATDSGKMVATNLSGKDLRKAEPAFDLSTGGPIVRLNFSAEGGAKFEEITKRNLNKQLAIFLDDQLLMAPRVESVISGGQAVISGKFTAAQTKQMAILLNSGALPAPVKVVEQRSVGATLGKESVERSLAAGLIGLSIVALFMIGNYGKLGLFANMALIIYALLVLAIFKIIPVTLTLAGIAGFILSIGMAVDANILIFERMREEVAWGKSKLAAIELGFSRAFPSIRDSNVSSLITCAILYWFGSGPVRGFAVTLAIGILVSLFTAVTVTRTLLRVFQR